LGKSIRYAALAYLACLALFTWGYAAATFKVFPHQPIESVVTDLRAYWEGANRQSVEEIIVLDHQERKSTFDFRGLRVADHGFRDDGYLLIARYDKPRSQSVVELFDLAQGRVVHTWVPDLKAIFSQTPLHQDGVNTRMAYRSQHPWLMENGDLLIGSGEGPQRHEGRRSEHPEPVDRRPGRAGIGDNRMASDGSVAEPA
jgi:hypothetical protein